MPLPSDSVQRCRWRDFVVARWKYERDIRFVCLEAILLGMDMRRADFLAIVREYVDSATENKRHGRAP